MELEPALNMVYAWHGCEWSVAEKVAREGFDERLAWRGGLYGTGCYFALEACKALQYARADGCKVQKSNIL